METKHGASVLQTTVTTHYKQASSDEGTDGFHEATKLEPDDWVPSTT